MLTISPISTKRTYDIGNPGPGLGKAQKCGRVMSSTQKWWSADENENWYNKQIL